LTVRIFLMTAAMMVAACAITYGAIAYLTPITYTSILADELDQKSRALTEALGKQTPAESRALLSDFVRDTGADLAVWDERGNVLYETAATSAAEDMAGEDMFFVTEDSMDDSEACPAERTTEAAQMSEASGGAILSAGEAMAEEGTPVATPGESYPVEETMAAEASVPGGAYAFAFADGTNATMSVTGGVRAVNQAAEALGRVLPFLVGVVLVISLAGSFLYARFITRPIVSISRVARRIASLDFEARWTKRRGDEIGALGDSLNLLSDNLSGALRELESANQTLQRDIDRERELDRQRLAFFSSVSHELKTPVTILKGQLSGMLARVGTYRDREKYLARALEVTGRMEGLVKEILTVSRIESGSFSLKATRLDLSQLLEKQLEMDAELFEQKSLTVEANLESTTVRGDEQLLAKALSNVLLNAILYSPSGASILVEAGDCAFTIENTGASIPEESLAELFTPFYRVEQSRSRKSGGSGLGLYLVKTILDRHGATCKIENTARGVRFTARFP
jgi:two-component system sensor histidine kinase VanS